jgi:predicted nucleic acid-binding protein
MRVFLDANILYMAAWRPVGPASRLIDLQDAQLCTLTTSLYAATEARRNIAFKAASSSDQLEHWLTHVLIVGESDAAHMEVAAQHAIPDISDIPILAAAIQSRSDILISADRRAFGHLFRKRCNGVELLRLEDALLRIIGQPLR